MWWDGDIPTPSSGNEEKSGSWLLIIIVVLFCVGLGVGLMMIGHDLFDHPSPAGDAGKPTETDH
jgi:hypothetical protein